MRPLEECKFGFRVHHVARVKKLVPLCICNAEYEAFVYNYPVELKEKKIEKHEKKIVGRERLTCPKYK